MRSPDNESFRNRLKEVAMLTRNLILAAAGAVALLAAAPAARADGWHGHGPWHGGGWHGYGWRPYGGYVYAPPPVIYAPPPVVYAPPPAIVIAPRIPMPFVAFGFN
jgi:hypothetical protein